jgi:hypothetical protein
METLHENATKQKKRVSSVFSLCRDTIADYKLIQETTDILKTHYHGRPLPRIWPVESDEMVFTVLEPLDQEVMMKLVALGWVGKRSRGTNYDYRHACTHSSTSLYLWIGSCMSWSSIVIGICIAVLYGVAVYRNSAHPS